MCETGKQEYLSASQARNAWVRMSKRRPINSKAMSPMAAYKCPSCPFWHLTSRNFRDRKEAMRREKPIPGMPRRPEEKTEPYDPL